MDFNSVEDLVKYLEQQNPKELIKASAGQVSKQYCPVCAKETNLLAREDGNLECLDGKHIIESK